MEPIALALSIVALVISIAALGANWFHSDQCYTRHTISVPEAVNVGATMPATAPPKPPNKRRRNKRQRCPKCGQTKPRRAHIPQPER